MPPFPTFLEGDGPSDIMSKDVYHPMLHPMDEPSIHFEAGEEHDLADVLKRATVKKQAKVRRK